MEEVIKLLSEIFKIPGDGAPEAEVRFRIRHPKLDEALTILIENGTLTKYEFPKNSGMWHYKLKKKLGIEQEEVTNESENGSEQAELVKIVELLAQEVGNREIINMITAFKKKYN